MSWRQNQTETEMSWSHPETGAVHDLDPKQRGAEKTDSKLTP